MALLKFGSLCTSGSGSVGGHTIQNSRGGIQLRNKPIPRGQASDSQRAVRNINPVLQAGWKALTNAQRKIWNDFAADPLSGHDLWMKYQYQRIFEELPFLINPSLHKARYLSNELVINGSFDSGAGWFLTEPWSISNGKAHFNKTSTNYMRTFLTVPNGTHIRLKITISNSIGVVRFAFTNNSGLGILPAPYTGVILLTNGIYIYDTITIQAITAIRIYSYNNSVPFSLDNVSLKTYL
jgi:hypothetical protein